MQGASSIYYLEKPLDNEKNGVKPLFTICVYGKNRIESRKPTEENEFKSFAREKR